jgi:hypothetical protein
MNFDFRPGGKQFVAVLLMLAAIAVLSLGEVAWGLSLIALSAVLSVGGLFYDAHRADVQAAAGGAQGAERPTAGSKPE